MNKKDMEQFKTKLLAEKVDLEQELASIGQKDPNAKGIWDASSGGMEVDTADENEVADKLEEYEGNNNILAQLDNQLIEVNSALDRIEKGTFGICEKCGKPIEKDRLEANPSARISIKHVHN
ncbi:MAG: TraR/DksA C4-type zinc finger protein [Candidatus Taylorbacteria bacterium]